MIAPDGNAKAGSLRLMYDPNAIPDAVRAQAVARQRPTACPRFYGSRGRLSPRWKLIAGQPRARLDYPEKNGRFCGRATISQKIVTTAAKAGKPNANHNQNSR